MQIDDHRLVGDDGNLVPFVESPNVGGKLAGGKPRFLVIHYTAGGSAAGTVNWFRNPAAKVSAHLVVGHDGEITQMVPFDTVGFHAGESRWKNVKGLNSHSVGIEIANWGKLNRTAAGGWVSATGKTVAAERVVLASHRHSPGAEHGWEMFDEAQVFATVAAAQAMVAKYGLAPWDVVGHEDISPLRKVDPGPAFNMDRFRSLVFGRAEDEWDDVLFRVRSDNGLKLRTGAAVGTSEIKTLPDDCLVHVIERAGPWWLVCEVVDGKDDVTGFVHSHFLQPA
jgi:N-acetylmuramoyl-L-alanine amidase